MEGLHKLKKMLLEELEEYSRKNELSPGSLEAIHKITDTVKNIDKIEMLEEYGESDESYESGGSYAGAGRTNRSGSYYGNGSYNRGGESSYARGGSRNRNRYGQFSGAADSKKQEMIELTDQIMDMADDERHREMIQKFREQLEML